VVVAQPALPDSKANTRGAGDMPWERSLAIRCDRNAQAATKLVQHGCHMFSSSCAALRRLAAKISGD